MLAFLFAKWTVATTLTIIAMTATAITGFIGWRVTASFASATTATIPVGMSMTPVVSFRPPTGAVNMTAGATAGPNGTVFRIRHATGSSSMREGIAFRRGENAGYQHLGRQGVTATTVFHANVRQVDNIQSSTTVRKVFFR